MTETHVGCEFVYLVDDDRRVCDAGATARVRWLRNPPTDSLTFAVRIPAACHIVDLRLPGMNRLDLQGDILGR
jgi:FixJ family two-component response regulator